MFRGAGNSLCLDLGGGYMVYAPVQMFSVIYLRVVHFIVCKWYLSFFLNAMSKSGCRMLQLMSRSSIDLSYAACFLEKCAAHL